MGKGDRRERQVAEVYDTDGGWVYRPENSRYDQNDMWGLFDLGCIQALTEPATLTLIQVKSNQSSGVTQWFKDTSPFRAVSGVRVHFVVVHDGQGGHNPIPPACRVAVPDSDGYEWVVDERDVECEFGDQLREYLAGKS